MFGINAIISDTTSYDLKVIYFPKVLPVADAIGNSVSIFISAVNFNLSISPRNT